MLFNSTMRLSRRRLLGLLMSLGVWSQALARQEVRHRLPDEAEPHAATWMAYGATASAWGTTGPYGASRVAARRDLMRVAVQLSRFEAVWMLVSKTDLGQAQQFLKDAKFEAAKVLSVGGAALPAVETGGKIVLIQQEVNDLWIRDTGPVFVRSGQRLSGVNFNFNGWGQVDTGAPGWMPDPEKARNGIEKQDIRHDRLIADAVIARTGVLKLKTWLVMEGGGLEVDGHGTAICTESCILNPNRNPGRSKAEIERELGRLFGIRKVIWLPGVKGKDITDGHVDFYARFVGRGRVVCGLETDPQSGEYAITHQHQGILQRATDAEGQALEVVPLVAPNFARVQRSVQQRNAWKGNTFNSDAFAAGYVGFYLANNCVLMAQFGDEAADQAAFATLQALYPTRRVMQIATDGLANGGGTIHCATQQQPALP